MRRFTMFLSTITVLYFTASISAAPLRPLAEWKGLVEDTRLLELKPANNVITDEQTFRKIWQAWRGREEVPEVNFRRDIVVVGTAMGPNRVLLTLDLDDGNLKTQAISTKIGGPGFGYALVKVLRHRIETVDGKPLEMDDEEESVKLEIRGRLQHGVAAIGGETTGTVVKAGDIELELDLGTSAKLRDAAQRLSGKAVFASGRLEKRRGVERGDRWVVVVDKLQAQ